MPNTYTQIHIHAVFAVQFRDGLIAKDWREELYKYITGIIQNNGHKLLAINGTEDHVHVFFGMRPTQSLSELIQDVKANSSRWINERKFVRGRFEWQSGYGAFSYSKSQVPDVTAYIQNQEEHHRKHSFQEEYTALLEKFGVEYDLKFTFKNPE